MRCVCIQGHECLPHDLVEAPRVEPRSMARRLEQLPDVDEYSPSRRDHALAAIAGLIVLAAILFGGGSR